MPPAARKKTSVTPIASLYERLRELPHETADEEGLLQVGPRVSNAQWSVSVGLQGISRSSPTSAPVVNLEIFGTSMEEPSVCSDHRNTGVAFFADARTLRDLARAIDGAAEALETLGVTMEREP